MFTGIAIATSGNTSRQLTGITARINGESAPRADGGRERPGRRVGNPTIDDIKDPATRERMRVAMGRQAHAPIDNAEPVEPRHTPDLPTFEGDEDELQAECERELVARGYLRATASNAELVANGNASAQNATRGNSRRMCEGMIPSSPRANDSIYE